MDTFEKSVARSTGVVIKVGGSLYQQAGLPDRLRELLCRQTGGCLLIPGGGIGADRVRALQPVYGWTERDAHERAIEAMSVAADMLAQLLGFELVDDWDALQAALEHQARVVVDVAVLPGLEKLPVGWHVTSDSIAAWVTIRLGLSRLILAKSVDCLSPSARWEFEAQQGLVDAYFPCLAMSIPQVEWANLRRRPVAAL
jgi:aspartokinase-like uncharacterized kinase